MECIYKSKLNDAHFCKIACRYCTFTQEASCKHKKTDNLNNAVIFIRFRSKYDDCDDDIGVAISADAANKYVENLRREYPDAYGERYGRFIFTSYNLIK